MGAPYMVFICQTTQLLKLKTWTLDDFGWWFWQSPDAKEQLHTRSAVTYAVCTDLSSVRECKTSLLRNSFVWLQSVGLTLQAHCSKAKPTNSLRVNQSRWAQLHGDFEPCRSVLICLSFSSSLPLFSWHPHPQQAAAFGIIWNCPLRHTVSTHNFPAMSRQPSAEQRHATCSPGSGRAKRGPAPGISGMCKSFHPWRVGKMSGALPEPRWKQAEGPPRRIVQRSRMKHLHRGPQGAVQAKRWSKQPLAMPLAVLAKTCLSSLTGLAQMYNTCKCHCSDSVNANAEMNLSHRQNLEGMPRVQF